MPAGRPKKAVTATPKRVDSRSEEYYLERALQTAGLLNGADYLRVLERLTQIRSGKPELPEQTIGHTETSDKLSGLLDKIRMQPSES